MSYYRHYDLDTRIGLMIGEWMYRKRTARQVSGGKPPAEPPYDAGGRADLLPPLPARSILEPVEFSEAPVHKFQAFESVLLFFVTAAAIVGGVLLLFIDL